METTSNTDISSFLLSPSSFFSIGEKLDMVLNELNERLAA